MLRTWLDLEKMTIQPASSVLEGCEWSLAFLSGVVSFRAILEYFWLVLASGVGLWTHSVPKWQTGPQKTQKLPNLSPHLGALLE